MLPSSGGVGCSRISESGDTRQPTPHTRESGQAQNEYTVQRRHTWLKNNSCWSTVVRRKKNRVYPSPEAVSRAPDSRERLRKYSLQSDTERPLTRGLVASCGPPADAAPAGIRTMHHRAIRTFARASGSRACTRTQATHL